MSIIILGDMRVVTVVQCDQNVEISPFWQKVFGNLVAFGKNLNLLKKKAYGYFANFHFQRPNVKKNNPNIWSHCCSMRISVS